MSKDTPDNSLQLNRRRFLGRVAASLPMLHANGAKLAVSSLLAAAPVGRAMAASDGTVIDLDSVVDMTKVTVDSLDSIKERRLHLFNAHTGDDVDLVYFKQDRYIGENLTQLDHLMRDRRANVSMPIATALYDQLFNIQRILNTAEPVHVLSGYRTPETNAKLRRRSSGVAKFSLHMEARAADIYIPGMKAKTIHEAALEMHAGGVGLYSKSNFVHLDTGAVRQWGN